MKVKIKQDEKKYIVCDQQDNIMSKWAKEVIDKEGGLEKIIERLKRSYEKLEVVIEGESPVVEPPVVEPSVVEPPVVEPPVVEPPVVEPPVVEPPVVEPPVVEPDQALRWDM